MSRFPLTNRFPTLEGMPRSLDPLDAAVEAHVQSLLLALAEQGISDATLTEAPKQGSLHALLSRSDPRFTGWLVNDSFGWKRREAHGAAPAFTLVLRPAPRSATDGLRGPRMVCRGCHQLQFASVRPDYWECMCGKDRCRQRARLALYVLAGWHVAPHAHVKALWRRAHGCSFTLDRKKDRALWAHRQAMLGMLPQDRDGIPGPRTRAAMKRANELPEAGPLWQSFTVHRRGDRFMRPASGRPPSWYGTLSWQRKEDRPWMPYVTAVAPPLWRDLWDIGGDADRAALEAADAHWSRRGRAWAVGGLSQVLEDFARSWVGWFHARKEMGT